MSWYAVDAIDEAFETSRSFLFPFEAGRWLRLAVIVFFLGSMPSGNLQLPSLTDVPSVPGGVTVDLLVGIALVILALIVVFGLIGSVMQFVLLDSIHTDSIHIRRYFRQQIGNGARLFLFELGAILVAVLPFIAGGMVFITGRWEPTGASFALGQLLLLFGVGIALFVGVLLDFTVSFVAPVMLLEDRGVISGWQRFWPTLKTAYKQYALYVVLNWLLNLMAGILLGITVLVIGLVMILGAAIPAVIVATFADVVGGVLFVLLGLLGVLVLLVSLLSIQILFKIYFRYYSLLILRKTNTEFDLVSGVDGTASDSTGVSE